MAGDFNLRHIDWENWSCPGKNVVTKESLFLDLCGRLWNLVQFNDGTVSELRTSREFVRTDHLPVSFSVQLPMLTPSESRHDDTTVNLDCAKGDYEMIWLNLSQTNTSSKHCANVDEMYAVFVDYLLTLRSLYVSRRMASREPSRADAHNAKLLNKIDIEANTAKLERLRRDLKRAIKGQRTLEEHKVVRSRNPKSIYNYINRRMPSKDHLSVLIYDAGEAVIDDVEKAEILKTHFESFFPTPEEVTRRDANPGPNSS